MKRIPKLLSAILVLALLISNVILTAAPALGEAIVADLAGTPVVYDTATNALAINGTGALPDVAEKPWQAYAADVRVAAFRPGITAIPDHFLDGCTGITTLALPASVQSIGEGVLTASPSLDTLVYSGARESLLNVQMSDADRAVAQRLTVIPAAATDRSAGADITYTYAYNGTTLLVARPPSPSPRPSRSR
ncbi:MAG: hypothetical protein IJ646_05100, partial [Clostridia bacterium]|nr:hypothetical protein [Clostridia bacterium]